jgi:RNA polymerase sigma-70 factor (ECF subfamily)
MLAADDGLDLVWVAAARDAGQGRPMNVEAEIARLRKCGDLRAAATLVIESYGEEVATFLDVMLRDHADSKEVFGQACEDLWKGLPRFEGRCAIKTWFYTLARHAASRLRRSSPRWRHAPLSDISEVAERVRSRTRPHLKTEVKRGVAAIRDALDEDDRLLLVLRVDRDMSWTDVARVMAGEDDGDSDEEITRVAARLRKRFQKVKEFIRKRAIAEGLVAIHDSDVGR